MLSLALALISALPPSSGAPFPDELQPVYDDLFVSSDVREAAHGADDYLADHPGSAPALELSWVAHWMLGDDALANERGFARARAGDLAASQYFIATWYRVHTAPADARLLAQAAKLIAPKVPADQRAALVDAQAHAERMAGHFDAAAALQASLARITDWQLIGPFDNDQNSGFDVAYGPEKAVDLAATYPGKNASVRWRAVHARDPDGRVAIGSFLYPSDWGVAYLATWVEAPRAIDAVIRADADDHLKVWVNGRLALSDDTARASSPDQYLAGVHLHAGWNQLIAKVAQRAGGWSLALRLTTAEGEPLKLRASADSHPFEGADEKEPWPATPEDAYLRALDQASVAVPRDYLRAWRLYDLGYFRKARAAFEKLHKEQPKAALYSYGAAMAALYDEDRDHGLSGLAEAVKLDPAFSRAQASRCDVYLAMGLTERAAEQGQAAVDANPGSAIALEALARVRKKQGAIEAARSLLAREGKAHPGWSPTQLLEAELDLQEGDPLSAERHDREALKAEPDSVNAAEALFKLEEQMGKPDAAARVMKERRAHHPDFFAPLRSLADLHFDFHQDAAAARDADALEKLCPQSNIPWRLRAKMAERRGDTPSALAAFRQALAREPADDATRDEVDRLDPNARATDRYMVSHQEILDRAGFVSAKDHPGANAVTLLDQNITLLHGDGSARVIRHVAFKALDQAGVDRHLNWEVGTGASLKILYAGTHSPDGTEHETSSIDHGNLHLPALEPGSVAEVLYSYDRHRSTSMGDYWWEEHTFGVADPTMQAEWVVLYPKDKAIRFSARGPHLEDFTENVGDYVARRFRATDLPPLPTEDLAPAWSRHWDVIDASSITGWDRVASLIHAVVDDQVVDDATIRAKAHELTKNASTPEAKIAALAHFVSSDVRYNQADTDIYQWRPHPARRVLESRYGDCKDKATLFIALARQVGIEAEMATLLTRNAGKTPDEVPNTFFNHAIAYLPAQSGVEKARFLDLTADGLAATEVPFMDQQAKAIVVKPGKAGYEQLTIPLASAEHSKENVRTKVVLQPQGDAVAEVTISAEGNAAQEYRHAWGRLDARQKAVGWIAGVWLFQGGVPVGDAPPQGQSSTAPAFSTHFAARVRGLMQRTGDTWTLRTGGFPALDAIARQSSRKLPIELGGLSTSEVHREFALPAGFRVARLPEDVHLDGPYFAFDAKYRQEPGRVLVDTTFRKKVVETPPAEYEGLRQATLAVLAAGERSVVLAGAAP